MPHSALSLFLSRLDFAWITSMHILYPPLRVSLSVLLFGAECYTNLHRG
jgi:cytochrome bd ubiquinol oxidase subunit I